MSEEDRNTLRDVTFWCFERNYPLLPTGSRTIGGATNESDWDYVLYAVRRQTETMDWLAETGWTRGGSEGPTSRGSLTYRKGNLNLMLVADMAVFTKWNRATEVAKSLYLETKNERIAVFEAVFNGYPMMRTLRQLEELDANQQRVQEVVQSEGVEAGGTTPGWSSELGTL